MSEEEVTTPEEQQPQESVPPETSEEPKENTPSEEPEEQKPEEEEPEKKEQQEEEKQEEQKPPEIDENDIEGSLKKIGFDYSELQEEFAVNGDLTPETRDKLKALGITDEAINSHIEGQKAIANRELDEIAQVIGGRDAMKETIEWAAKNLSQEEIGSINAVRDTNIMKIVLKDLRERMEEKEGKLPNYTQGQASPPQGDYFESKAQMIEAVKDPRYAKDPAYREKVAKKVRASREAGMNLEI